ncbi:MAG: DUF5655 domain-containing protein [Gilvibacter sp.]
MKLFSIKKEALDPISPNPFKLEKDIQSLIENNVTQLFDLQFVKSELKVQNFRFDTLCFDPESKSFVIIEYKKGSSYSVIDQGYTYLSLLLNNKSDFILEYNEVTGQKLRRDEVDWKYSKIIFISPKFSTYQRNSVNFKNVPFELWEVTRFKNNILGLNQLSTDSEVDINATFDQSDSKTALSQVSKEVIKIDENYHLNKAKNRPEWVIELYYELKRRILDLGDSVEVKFKKQTIGFKDRRWFADLIIYNKGVVIMINMKKGSLEDLKNLAEDVSEKGHWGNGDYKITLNSDKNFEYVLHLIYQSYLNQKD